MEVCKPEDRTGIGKFFDTPTRREQFDYSYNGIMRSFEASLERLGVDRVDILFAHDLDIFNQGSREVMEARQADFFASGIRAMTMLRDQGVIKAIGAGINEWEAAQTLLERCDMDLFLLAGRYTLLEQEALNSFLPMCENAASVLFWADRTIPEFWRPVRSRAPGSTMTRRRKISSIVSERSRPLQGSWREVDRSGAALSAVSSLRGEHNTRRAVDRRGGEQRCEYRS